MRWHHPVGVIFDRQWRPGSGEISGAWASSIPPGGTGRGPSPALPCQEVRLTRNANSRTYVLRQGRLARVNTHSTALAPDARARGWPDLADVDLLRTLVETERRRRRLDAAMRAAVAEAERRGLAADTGYRDTVELLTDLLRISVHEARRRIEYAAPQARSRSRKVWRVLAAAS
nr:DUF222 domain-containing protein [Nocardia arthritidis]